MKCKLCGHRTNSLAKMAAHYRACHPRSTRKTVKKKTDHNLGKRPLLLSSVSDASLLAELNRRLSP